MQLSPSLLYQHPSVDPLQENFKNLSLFSLSVNLFAYKESMPYSDPILLCPALGTGFKLLLLPRVLTLRGGT